MIFSENPQFLKDESAFSLWIQLLRTEDQSRTSHSKKGVQFMISKSFTLALGISLFFGMYLSTSSPALAAKKAAIKKFEIKAILKDGTKYWIPGDIKVNKGDAVKIHLVNTIQGENNIHGFKIADYNVELLVNNDKPQDVEFVADRAGEFKIFCHLHPAHVGGKMTVQ
jgi:plastocyanin